MAAIESKGYAGKDGNRWKKGRYFEIGEIHTTPQRLQLTRVIQYDTILISNIILTWVPRFEQLRRSENFRRFYWKYDHGWARNVIDEIPLNKRKDKIFAIFQGAVNGELDWRGKLSLLQRRSGHFTPSSRSGTSSSETSDAISQKYTKLSYLLVSIDLQCVERLRQRKWPSAFSPR